MSNRDNPSVVRGMNHVGLTVPDMDQATDFLQKALDAKFVYDGLTASDEPRKGADLERQVGFSPGTLMIKQRLLRIGNGANIELFEIASDRQSKPVGLQDFGWNHISFYVDDINYAIDRVTAAGGRLLSEVHQNSRHEDTENSTSVYFFTPWGSLIELQSVPNGYYYPDNSEAKIWVPEPDKAD